MSLAELTRNCFQSGISSTKWLELCKLLLSKESATQFQGNLEVDLSNSVLVLYRSYPGDPDLQEYLKHAIRDSSLSIATFVATLLQAARSPELHAPATLDTLCRVALDAHYSSGLPPIGSVILYDESPITVLGIVQDALALLRTAHSLPLSHFHQLTTSTSELVIVLLSCVSDISQVSTAQAMVHFADANDLLQNFQLSPDVRQVLETFVLSLSLLIGDDAKAAREAQLMHTIQLALGKGNLHGPSSDTDIVTFSLVLHHLVSYRAHECGSGDSQGPIALLVALFRWAAWSPTVLYTQMFLSAFTCLSQCTSNVQIWKGFIIGRLPQLLIQFESVVNADGVSSADWRRALQAALLTCFRQSELIAQCDHAISRVKGAHAMQEDKMTRSFFRELLQNMITLDLIPASFATGIDPLISNDDIPRLQVEAQDCGVELETYLESKSTSDTNVTDLRSWIDRVSHDVASHSAFAAVILRRFTTLSMSFDVDALSHLCKVLYTYEAALDIMALHMKISDLIFRSLSFLDQYDCETVGDPQTAVSHLGDVVLFVQYATSRFHADVYNAENQSLTSTFLKSTDSIYPIESLSGEDAAAFTAWFKALFDSGSEGIEDSILRSTQPKTLLKISATLFLQAIKVNMAQKIDRDTLNNGVSYFTGPLLNWTLVGIIKALIKEIQQKGFSYPTYYGGSPNTITLTLMPLSCSSALRA
ncbi:mediator complex subunit Med5-domain-containing protein [Lyophyllum atratum]|nr:mediator complex subunit Med5-domain-containing protein [Lyophyllum atratum]